MLLPPCFIVVTASRPTKVPEAEAEALLPLVSTSWTDTVLLIILQWLMAVQPSWHLDLFDNLTEALSNQLVAVKATSCDFLQPSFEPRYSNQRRTAWKVWSCTTPLKLCLVGATPVSPSHQRVECTNVTQKQEVKK